MNPLQLRPHFFLGTLFLTLLLLSACAITVRTPVNRLESPEVSQTGTFSADAGLVGVHETTIVPDVTSVPPSTNAREISDGGSLKLGAYYSALDALEIGLKFHFSGTPALQAKYQFLQGQIPLALVASYGYSNSSKSVTGISSQFQSVSAQSESNVQIIDVGALVGVRANENFLFYGGGFQTWAPYDGQIDQTVSNVVTKYYYSGQVTQTSYVLGLKFGTDKSGAMLEAGYGVTEDGARRTRFQFAGGGRFSFN